MTRPRRGRPRVGRSHNINRPLPKESPSHFGYAVTYKKKGDWLRTEHITKDRSSAVRFAKEQKDKGVRVFSVKKQRTTFTRESGY